MDTFEKILITGASGFVGSRVTEYLQDKYTLLTPSHAELDITSAEAIERYIQIHRPEVILHLAAISNTGYCEEHPDESLLVNVTSVENMYSSHQTRSTTVTRSWDFLQRTSLPHPKIITDVIKSSLKNVL